MIVVCAHCRLEFTASQFYQFDIDRYDLQPNQILCDVCEVRGSETEAAVAVFWEEVWG